MRLSLPPHAPEVEIRGRGGVYQDPGGDQGRRVRCTGGSLAITPHLKNKDAAWAYIEYGALATPEGQIPCSGTAASCPRFSSHMEDIPYVKAPSSALLGRPGDLVRPPRHHGQDLLGPPSRHPAFPGMPAPSSSKAISDYLAGTFKSPKEALGADAAKQIIAATGLR